MVQYLPDPNFIPILFFYYSLFGSFFFFCPPLTFPLPSFFFSFSYSFPIQFLLLVSFFLPLSTAFLSLFPPFLHFSHRLALMPAPSPNTPSKNPEENTDINGHTTSIGLHQSLCTLPDIQILRTS